MKYNNVEILKLDDFGRGIAFINDKIVFVENALPKEIVDIEILKETKKYYEAKIFNYVEKSKNRIDAICPYYEICGGCSIMHLSYDDQLRFKQEKVNNVLNKVCNKQFNINKIIYNEQFNYRNKVTLKVSDNKIGFYEKSTNNIVEVDYCYLLDNELNKIINELKKIKLTNIYEIMIKKITNGNMIVFKGNNIDKDEILKIKEYVSCIYMYDNKYIHVYGEKYLKQKLNNIELYISPDSFMQVNTEMCIRMYEIIKSKIKNCNRLLDLYCGVGSIGLYVNDKCKALIGIEVNEQAILDANKNKNLNNFNNAQFYNGKVNDVLKSIKNDFDYVIVDPPRSGLDNKTIELIKNIKSNNLIYVSCDVMTLARDINQLSEIYDVVEITPLDMFPNTYHVECISVLKIKNDN